MLLLGLLGLGLLAFGTLRLAVQYGGADVAGAGAQDGFEEWAFLPGTGRVPNPVPEPGSMALLGLGFAALGFTRKTLKR